MKTVIVDRKPSETELHEHVKEGTRCIITDRAYSIANRDNILASITEEEKKEENKRVMQELMAFSAKKIQGKSILEGYCLEGQHLYFYHRFRVYFDVRNSRYKIRGIEKEVKTKDDLTLLSNDPLLNHYFKKQYQVPDGKILIHAAEKKNPYVDMAHLFLILGLRALQAFFQWPKVRKIQKAFIDNREQYAKMLSADGKHTGTDNFYLGYLHEKSKNFFLIDKFNFPKIGQERFRYSASLLKNHQKRKRLNEEHLLLRYYSSGFFRSRRKLLKKSLREIHDHLTANTDPNHPYQSLILRRFISLEKSSLFFIHRFLAYKRFFENSALKVVCGMDEYSPNNKSVFEAAKVSGIQTVGFQHGSIHGLHPGYIYSEQEAITNPFPDFFIAWGEKWKNLLIQSGKFPEPRISVLGQLRTDIIPRLQELNPVSNDGVKKVLFASQPQRDVQLREQTTHIVMKAFKNRDGMALIIKPHPREKDLDYFHRIATSVGCHDYQIVLDDLYKMMSECTAVITSFSTVGTEAVYFRKPLIIVDVLGQDVMDYVKDGVGLLAKDSTTLSHLLDDLNKGKKLIDKNLYERYIFQHAHSIDGKVAKRYADLIEEILHQATLSR